ncbi:flagellar protein FlgN [Aeromonas encheleia]|jgi:flagella synthesis protein FlgN|uniref:Flagellar protein FlgN n=1 Tax=Aeromonas encheleia TaxID=73010 RepID=A0AAE9MJB3_9GAMM|nr:MULTISPECIES: flagellar protein FlgN [Aeromonas]MBV7438447.1 flagellar protein FlgN [Aeromonas sp. sif2416]MBV7598840.1 flagellar protein FlgN [Aeromonas sp. sia0103]UNP89695.1 flagellar protein FlgN [Aeromonas encheleia]USV58870.1 flagellar protein FlgN [Aeromonas encheleia]
MMDLPSLLHAQDEYLSQMQALLAEEFDLLKQHQALALPALAERKQQLLATIEALDKSLAELPDLRQQLSAFPAQLHSLQTKLDACQEQNDLNGRLLELSIVSNRRLASFLSKLRDRNSLTYDAKGNTRSGTRSQGIKA